MMKRYYSIPSILGGRDIFDMEDRIVGYSVPGFFGGEDIYLVDGDAGYSVDAPFDGSDFFVEEDDQDDYQDNDLI